MTGGATTRALVATAPKAAPEVTDIVLPDLPRDGVRVKLLHAGICHSDLSMIDGTVVPEFPVVLGHEAAGEVLEVGPDVSDLAAGTRVALNWSPPCRSCWNCRNDEPWLCTANGGVSQPYGSLLDGTPLNMALAVGAFAEQAVVQRRAVVPLPEGIATDVAALMSCAVLTGVGAVRNTAKVRSGQSVAVFGLGGVGLSAILGAQLAGAHPIIGIDVNESKAATAKRAGATDFVVFDDQVVRAIRRLTDRRGVDHAFECVGRPATIEASWASTRRGGNCVVLGVGALSETVSLRAMEIHHYGRTLQASVRGSSDSERDIPILADLVRAEKLDLEQLISHRISLDEAPAAFDRMRAGQGVRSVIEFAGT